MAGTGDGSSGPGARSAVALMGVRRQEGVRRVRHAPPERLVRWDEEGAPGVPKV